MQNEYELVTSNEAGHHQVVCLPHVHSPLESKISKQWDQVLPLHFPVSFPFLKVIQYLLRASSSSLRLLSSLQISFLEGSSYALCDQSS
jgi:hypothetical protein